MSYLHAEFCSGKSDLFLDKSGVPYRSCLKCGAILRGEDTLGYAEYRTLLNAFKENAILRQRIEELECQMK